LKSEEKKVKEIMKDIKDGWGWGREMENISRAPTFGDFFNVLTEGSMQDITVARLQSTRL
jgi:hypothetical protein